MNAYKLIAYVSTFLLLVIGITLSCKRIFMQPSPKLFSTEQPKKRTITQKVFTSGTLELRNTLKIGSIVSGIVKEILVKENQLVKKGQLMATIDPGTGETDFESAYQEYQKTEHNYNYIKRNHERQQQLFKTDQLSKDAFERITKDLFLAEQDFKKSKTQLDKQRLLLSNRKIIAPGKGIVTAVNISQGSGVTGADVGTAPSLFEMAPDITCMEAKLDIDESDIGHVEPGQRVLFSITTYPDRMLQSKIKNVDFSPKKTDANGKALFYKAIINIDNSDKLFRPGMAINAQISVSKAKNVLTIRGITFQTNPKALKAIAKKIGYTFKPLQKKVFRKFKRQHRKQRVKSVWVAESQSFIEKTVILGLTDDNHFEVISGITASDNLISDVMEEDEMEKVYKKWFQGAL